MKHRRENRKLLGIAVLLASVAFTLFCVGALLFDWGWFIILAGTMLVLIVGFGYAVVRYDQKTDDLKTQRMMQDWDDMDAKREAFRRQKF